MHSIRICSPGVEDKAGSVAAAGEHFQPLVECGPLWLEEDVPFLKQAEAALRQLIAVSLSENIFG